MSQLPQDTLAKAATVARGLAIDAVHASQSGHLGLPLGCAEIGAVLFGYALRHDPAKPAWLNRDRFVLSAGHGSMFLYAWLHLSRVPRLHARRDQALPPDGLEDAGTPRAGAPARRRREHHGPAGQGIANAVGMAVAAKMAEARFNTPEHTIFDHHIVVLAGDGCMQEGVAMEALEFAGHQQARQPHPHLRLERGHARRDGQGDAERGHRQALRGHRVRRADGRGPRHGRRSSRRFERAQDGGSGKPQIIIAKTLIGKGIPEVEGTSKAHGEGGAKFADGRAQGAGPARRALLRVPRGDARTSPSTRRRSTARTRPGARRSTRGRRRTPRWPSSSRLAGLGYTLPGDTAPRPTRGRSSPRPRVRRRLEDRDPQGRARRAAAPGREGPARSSAAAPTSTARRSTTSAIQGGQRRLQAGHRAGRNIRFGIREHGMCSILNGIAQHGIFRASGATFLVFADYCRAAIRLAALSHLPVTYVFTHDSVGVGEDGPTHQPVETIPGLRVIPNLDVDPSGRSRRRRRARSSRPSSGIDGPTLLALTRQAVPLQNGIPVQDAARGRAQGRLRRPQGDRAARYHPDVGGQRAAARAGRGRAARAGHARREPPCFARFDRQPAAYRDEVLPRSCRRRVSIEATVTSSWAKYVGLDGVSIGIDRFGISAPGNEVMAKLGMTADNVVATARKLAELATWLGPGVTTRRRRLSFRGGPRRRARG